MGVYVIAEAGVNHNGSLERAMRMIDVAAESGADAVKFQTFHSESTISRFAPKADYQVKNTGVSESQLEMVKRLELGTEAHRELAEHAGRCGIEFLSTPFDLQSVDLLAKDIKVSRLKVASGEITNAPLLLHVARSGLPVILSTGMSTLGEVEEALGVIAFGYLDGRDTPGRERFKQAYISAPGQQKLEQNLVLLHCTTEYPTPFADVNLRAMDTLAAAFGLPVGLSDHTVGYSAAVAAAARGAVVIEKHFTLDKSLPGPDHVASLAPDELRAMIKAVREVELSLGTPRKLVATSESKNVAIARKSLVALRQICRGSLFTEANLGCKRPGGGVSPMLYWEYLGRVADRDYNPDEQITGYCVQPETCLSAG